MCDNKIAGPPGRRETLHRHATANPRSPLPASKTCPISVVQLICVSRAYLLSFQTLITKKTSCFLHLEAAAPCKGDVDRSPCLCLQAKHNHQQNCNDSRNSLCVQHRVARINQNHRKQITKSSIGAETSWPCKAKEGIWSCCGCSFLGSLAKDNCKTPAPPA